MTLLEKLIHRLSLERISDHEHLGRSGSGGVTANDRLFGGLVAAQATVAAARAASPMPIHSLHGYFLRPGRPHGDISYQVDDKKQGRNFRVVSVDAWQQDKLIFTLQASFHAPEDGAHHQDDMPQVPDPLSCPNRDDLKGRENWREMPLDVRMVTPITGNEPLPPEQRVWLNINGAIPDDPIMHLALLVYASDRSLLDTAWRPHADRGVMGGASLDHSMWFHQAPRMDDWHLYTTYSPAADAGRGLAFGAIYNRQGRRIVSVAQEGLMRIS